MPASIRFPDQAAPSAFAMGSIGRVPFLITNPHQTNVMMHASTIGNGAAATLDNPLMTSVLNQNLSLSELSRLYASANHLTAHRPAYNPLFSQGVGLLETPQNYQMQLNYLQRNNALNPQLQMALQATSSQPLLENRSQIGNNNIQLSDYINRLANNLVSESAHGQLARLSPHGNSLTIPGMDTTFNNINRLEQLAQMYEQQSNADSLAALGSSLTHPLHNLNVIRQGQTSTLRDHNNLINFSNGIQGQTNLSVDVRENLRGSVSSLPPPTQNNPTNFPS